MKKPVLVIMAAGMGSRYGGLKQIDPIDEDGHIIIDFSIFDAVRAGFEDVFFIIKKENETDFREAIGDRISKYVNVHYVHQDLYNIPDEFTVPEGRVKPWGTGHAVLSLIYNTESPIVVINADDFYGREAFQLAYDYLSQHVDDDLYRYMMVGYELGKTLTDYGHVSRGVCVIDENSRLTSITERTHIEKRPNGAVFTEDDGKTWTEIGTDTIVSMNMWGFSNSILDELQNRFPAFLEKGLKENPMKCEYFLPTVVSQLLAENKAAVKVLSSKDQWFGVTYQEDRPKVVEAVKALKTQGIYPEHLWEALK